MNAAAARATLLASRKPAQVTLSDWALYNLELALERGESEDVVAEAWEMATDGEVDAWTLQMARRPDYETANESDQPPPW